MQTTHKKPSLKTTTFTITLCFSFALVSQYPLSWLYTSNPLMWTNLTLHILCCITVLFCLHANRVHLARSILCLTYFSYVTCSTLLWFNDLYIQHFMLVGCVVSTYLFSAAENHQLRLWCSVFAIGFIALDSQIGLQLVEWQNAIRLSNSITLAVASVALTLYLSGLSHRRWHSLSRDYKHTLQTLHAVAPTSRLVNQPKTKTREHLPFCCVLFTDIKGYQHLYLKMEASTLLNHIDDLYRRFDNLATQYGIVPVKTNGDEYIAASALNTLSQSHTDCVNNTLEFANKLRQQFVNYCEHHHLSCQIRIGLAAGPVNAGLANRDYGQFDIWGKTVNLAASLEQTATPNSINLCTTTFNHLPQSWQLACQTNHVQTKTGGIECYTLRPK